MSARPTNLCPCGCGSSLGSGPRRKIVCPEFWARLPVDVRSDLASPASDLATRRVAARTIYEMAAKHRKQTEQLTLDL